MCRMGLGESRKHDSGTFPVTSIVNADSFGCGRGSLVSTVVNHPRLRRGCKAWSKAWNVLELHENGQTDERGGKTRTAERQI